MTNSNRTWPGGRRCLVALALAGAALELGAQAPPARGTAFIMGQVIDAGTGAPAGGAVVTMTSGIFSGLTGPADEIMNASAASGTQPVRLVADANGRFVYRDLAAGRYGLAAAAPGYLSGAYGIVRPGGAAILLDLGDAEKAGDVTIRLWKPAAINGAVTDEAGEPAVGVQVTALRRTIAAGTRRWTTAGSALTDDRGVFRIAGQLPGEFIVGLLNNQNTLPLAISEAYGQAAGAGATTDLMSALTATGGPSPSASGFRVGDSILQMGPTPGRSIPPSLPPPAPSAGGGIRVYPTLFYPNAATSTQATVIVLPSGGEKNNVDVQLRLAAAVRVSGVVTGPDGPAANLGLRLLPAALDEFSAESGTEVATTATDAKGAFTFLGVASGQYVIKALKVPRAAPPIRPVPDSVSVAGAGGVSFGTAAPSNTPPRTMTDPTLWASMLVSVGEADVTGLAVALRAGVRVSGRIEFTGTTPPPTGDPLVYMTVLLGLVGTTPALSLATGTVSVDHQFASPGYAPGTYLLRMRPLPAPWTMTKAMFNGRDISDEPFEIGNTDLAGIVITLSDRTTEISGTVRNEQGEPDARADIVAFPADNTWWREHGINARRAKTVRTGRTGAYVLSGLPPGEYFVAAIGAAANGEWPDPKFLESLTRVAARVTIADGDRTSCDLKTLGGR